MKQLKGLILESVREVLKENKQKQALIAKWKGSGRSNGIPDWEFAQQMYDAGLAMKDPRREREFSITHQLTLDDMKRYYPGFTAEDFIEVAEAIGLDMEKEPANSSTKKNVIAKWKGSGRSNGMPDWEFAQQMYDAGLAMKDPSREQELLGVHQLSLRQMKEYYPEFTAKDFIEVAKAIDPDVGSD